MRGRSCVSTPGARVCSVHVTYTPGCPAQLVHTYSAALQRNDQALFHYGFIQSHDPPKLAAQDLPGGNLYDVPKYTEADYSEYSSSAHCMPVKADSHHHWRLAAPLACLRRQRAPGTMSELRILQGLMRVRACVPVQPLAARW